MTDFSDEEKRAGGFVIGVDEVGRGPLAGPMCACACVLDTNMTFHKNFTIRDSKKMSASQRERTAEFLKQTTSFFITECSPEEIDEIGIQKANQKILKEALQQALKHAPTAAAFVDYFAIPGFETVSIPKADNTFLSVAAASIIAKVHRDATMQNLAQEFPHYGWHTNMGYGTAQHREAIQKHGLTPHHRRSFTTAFSARP